MKRTSPNTKHFGTAEFIAEAGTVGERKYRGGEEGILRPKRPPRPP
ncbi:MAG: hypothetical protein PHH84_08695 [Oscillospiraceae bacterium]|nr:hypothetical protein [Oscillospiraceae bacterium]